MEELKVFLFGGSDKYEFIDICKYLEVIFDMWFGEWSEC